MAKLLSFLPTGKSKSHRPSHDRAGHCTAVIRDTLYLWGGHWGELPSEHDSEEKRKMTSVVEMFQLDTGQWSINNTRGLPPLGVSGTIHYY